MVPGIDNFRKYFAGFENQYVIIGGTACDYLMANEGLPFRSTKDLDLVLLIEVLDSKFVNKFWQFISDGEYINRSRSNGKPQFYRFSKPKSHDFPEMIELFARENTRIVLPDDAYVTRIATDDEIFSLSAIMLDNEYYALLQHGNIVLDGVSFLDYPYIVPFKMKAWLDLNEKNKKGVRVDSRDIKKHKNDIFRLFQLFTGEEEVDLPDAIKDDMRVFVDVMNDEEVDFENLGIDAEANVNKEIVLNRLRNIYKLN